MLRNYAVVVGANETVVGFGASEGQAWDDARAQGIDLAHARLVDFDADRYTPSFVDGAAVIVRRSHQPLTSGASAPRAPRPRQRSRSSTA